MCLQRNIWTSCRLSCRLKMLVHSDTVRRIITSRYHPSASSLKKDLSCSSVCQVQLPSSHLRWSLFLVERDSMDVVNPCFTPAAQYGRVTVQPVANLIYFRCSSFLHHGSFEEWTYTGSSVSKMVFGYSGDAEQGWSECMPPEMQHYCYSQVKLTCAFN